MIISFFLSFPLIILINKTYSYLLFVNKVVSSKSPKSYWDLLLKFLYLVLSAITLYVMGK